jgi:hypothetical protein
MTKYVVSWDEVVTFSIDIEAANKDHALDKWNDGDYNFSEVVERGSDAGVIFDSILVEEVNEVSN